MDHVSTVAAYRDQPIANSDLHKLRVPPQRFFFGSSSQNKKGRATTAARPLESKQRDQTLDVFTT
jgi:hypothetical protein